MYVELEPPSPPSWKNTSYISILIICTRAGHAKTYPHKLQYAQYADYAQIENICAYVENWNGICAYPHATA